MMRSLFAGVSGLKNHQTRMDVIGNNIANVNTIGFKKSRVTFQDMLSQTMRGASSPTATRGGTNPIQVGLGMTLASIDTIQTPGSPQSTGKNTDLSIEGEGFFVLGEGNRTYYTRAGNFEFDDDKNFYNASNGMLVKGYLADANGNINTNTEIVDINLSSQVSAPPKETTFITYSKNLDFTATPLKGNITVPHAEDGTETVTLGAASLPVTTVNIGTLVEGTNYTVDYLKGEVTFMNPSPAGPHTIEYTMSNHFSPMKVFDSLGNDHMLTVYYTKTDNPNEWLVTSKIDDEFLSPGRGTGLLTFDQSTGKLTTSAVSHATTTIPGVDPIDIELKFGDITQYAADFTALGINQDGYEQGYLDSISVDTSGVLTGSFSNGRSRNLAQIAIATFPNPSGLLKAGNNMFTVSNNSGEPDKGIPGISGRGIIKPESLEMSNVDLSQEFVDMIITQRGFQANSRVITTSDSILEELVNLKR